MAVDNVNYPGGSPNQVEQPGQTAQTKQPGNQQTQSPWLKGGGWGDPWAQNATGAMALEQALNQGLTGQSAVDWAQSSGGVAPGTIAWYGDSGTYGAPGWYAAPNKSGGGALDLIQRAGGGGGGTGGGGAYTPGSGVPGQGTIFGSGTPGFGGESGSLYDILMGRAKQSLQINPNDPVMRNQMDAYDAQLQRGERAAMQNLAEKAGPYSNLDVQRRIIGEQGAQAGASYEGQLMQNELNARRQEIQSALSGMSGLLTAEQQMALQEELGQLGLAQGAYQFDVNNQYRYSPFAGGG